MSASTYGVCAFEYDTPNQLAVDQTRVPILVKAEKRQYEEIKMDGGKEEVDSGCARVNREVAIGRETGVVERGCAKGGIPES